MNIKKIKTWQWEVKNDDIQLQCLDFLKKNNSLTAHKARRKNMKFIVFSIKNTSENDSQIHLSNTSLKTESKILHCKKREEIYKQLYEWRWIAVFFMIISLHWIEFLIEVGIFFIDSLINRRIRKNIESIEDANFILPPGHEHRGILAFQPVTDENVTLNISYEVHNNLNELSCKLKHT